MRFGVHIRTAEGLTKALDRAVFLGCETVQMFSSNPNAWTTQPIDPEQSRQFAQRCASLDIRPVVLHTPYLINLASPDDDIWRKSIQSVVYAVNKAEAMDAGIIVTHVGSHKGAGVEFGMARVAEAANQVLDRGSKPLIALELGSGAGRMIGSTFAQIAMILEKIADCRRVRICIDAAHLYAAGYDISTRAGVDAMYEELDREVGKERLCLVHLNDTQQALSGHRDKHYHIGKGNIGIDGFRALINHPFAADLPGIIETPGDIIDFDVENLSTLRALSA